MALDLATTAIPGQRDPASARQAEPHAGAPDQAGSHEAMSRLTPIERADGKRGEQSGLEQRASEGQREAAGQPRRSELDARGQIVDLRA